MIKIFREYLNGIVIKFLFVIYLLISFKCFETLRMRGSEESFDPEEVALARSRRRRLISGIVLPIGVNSANCRRVESALHFCFLAANETR